MKPDKPAKYRKLFLTLDVRLDLDYICPEVGKQMNPKYSVYNTGWTVHNQILPSRAC